MLSFVKITQCSVEEVVHFSIKRPDEVLHLRTLLECEVFEFQNIFGWLVG